MENIDCTALFLKLKNMGIKEVSIDFSGGGDSGDIDSIEFYDKTGYSVQGLTDDKSQFTDLAWDIINGIAEDWYNNDGGHGTVTIDVETATYNINLQIRYTEYTSHGYEGEITEHVK